MNRPPVAPGESYTYDFMAKPVGSHAYHSHYNATKQVPMGLFGAFIVEPVDPIMKPQVAHEYTMILNDGPLGYTLNGKSFPATRPLSAKWGDSILIRFMNQGLMAHAMHLHGMPVRVVSKDGYQTPIPYYCDTLPSPRASAGTSSSRRSARQLGTALQYLTHSSPRMASPAWRQCWRGGLVLLRKFRHQRESRCWPLWRGTGVSPCL